MCYVYFPTFIRYMTTIKVEYEFRKIARYFMVLYSNTLTPPVVSSISRTAKVVAS